jgi:hypothetical protein
MWVRSQDRKILTDVHNLYIDDINQIWDCSSLLGKYSSEEKALKVLDEIQELIYFNAKDNGFTYQMPQDEDVEV